MNDPADDTTIVHPLDTANISRQMRLDPSPLLVAQPKQIAAHDPDPFQTNQHRMESGLSRLSTTIIEF
jgi:hypothetical protein